MKTKSPEHCDCGSWRRHSRKIMAATLATSFVCLFSVPAQTPTTNALDPEAVQKLMQRLDDLEQKAKRVDDLEAQVKSLKSGAPAAPEEPVIRESWPKVTFNLLGDVDYHVSGDKSDKNTFAQGDIDPVVTAKLSEKAGVLGDFVIAADQEGFAFEVERLLLQYNVNDYLHIEAGRFHTMIGYYNNTYHNGTYFQTTTERPAMYLFEDGEGILPVHNNGISINGDIPSGSLRLRYIAEIGNGRSYSTNLSPFQVEDNNDFKAFNVALQAKPEWAPGLVLGGSAYHDTLTPTGVPRTDQLIFSCYAVYKNQTFEWLNEGVFMRDAPQGDHAHWTSAAYTQVSRKFGKVRPYFRLQWRNTPASDPVMTAIGENFSVWGPTAGIRYDFTPMMALKFEYEYTCQRDVNPLNEFTVQWTFRY